MLKRLLLSLCLFAAGDAHAATALSPFQTVLNDYYEDYLALFPVDAAVNGNNDSRYEAVWPVEIGAAHRAKVAAMATKYLAALGKFDRAQLATTDQLSYDTLTWILTLKLEGTKQIYALLPVNQFSCPTLTFAQMASGAYVHPFKTAQDYRNFLSRARGFTTWVDTAIANMREGMARGVVQPRILMERVLTQLAPLMADDPVSNILFNHLQLDATNCIRKKPIHRDNVLVLQYRSNSVMGQMKASAFGFRLRIE